MSSSDAQCPFTVVLSWTRWPGLQTLIDQSSDVGLLEKGRDPEEVEAHCSSGSPGGADG